MKVDLKQFFKGSEPMLWMLNKSTLVFEILTAVAGALVAAPIALPTAVVAAASYLAVAGSVVSAVSQVTVQKDEE